MAGWRRALADAVSDQDMIDVIQVLVREAKDGKQWAVKELLNRTLGRPVEADLIERIEAIEATADAKDAA